MCSQKWSFCRYDMPIDQYVQANAPRKQLAKALDRPLFPWKRLIVGFSVAKYVFEEFLSFRQYRVLQRKKPPKTLEDEVSQETFDKSQAYGRAKSKFGLVSGLFEQLQSFGILYYDILPKLWSWTGSLVSSYAPATYSGEIVHTLAFLFFMNVASTVIGMPFSYYRTFVLEEKFGFNKQTLKLWFVDMLKSQLLTALFGAPIISTFLWIIQRTGNQFFLWVWLFTVAVSMFMITIYPIVIVPFFNKLSPLEEGPLKKNIDALAHRLKFPLSELYVIDGSKRSSHSNAYFSGMPWKKHIVLFDTLIEKQEPKEIEAVLGHELGHWALSHTTKMLAIAQLHTFYIFTLFSCFINNRSMYAAFGFKEQPIIIGLILFSDILSPMDAIFTLLMNILSRRNEFQAGLLLASLGNSCVLTFSQMSLPRIWAIRRT